MRHRVEREEKEPTVLSHNLLYSTTQGPWMSERTAEIFAEQSATDKLDAGEFASAVRQLAIEADPALKSAETCIKELTRLTSRFESLLRQTEEADETEVALWLRRGYRAIQAKLHT